jgi:sortase A
MRKVSLALVVVIALGAGLTYASFRGPTDGPTLLPAEPTTAPAPKPKPRPVAKKRPPSHTAHLNIPRIGVRERVTMGLDAGPAFWPVTGRPGGGDTIAIAGHRTTHTRPFLRIDRLRPGDNIYVRYQGRVRRYVVTGTRVRPATDLHIADAVGHERLLLTACSTASGAPTSLDYRIVVYARPVG